MMPIVLLTAAGLLLAAIGTAAGRRLRPADARGIALQTVIIMVVLVVIAGAAATILVSRAGEETDRLEDADSKVDAAEYGSETLCEQADYQWDDTTDPSNPVCKPKP